MDVPGQRQLLRVDLVECVLYHMPTNMATMPVQLYYTVVRTCYSSARLTDLHFPLKYGVFSALDFYLLPGTVIIPVQRLLSTSYMLVVQYMASDGSTVILSVSII